MREENCKIIHPPNITLGQITFVLLQKKYLMTFHRFRLARKLIHNKKPRIHFFLVVVLLIVVDYIMENQIWIRPGQTGIQQQTNASWFHLV